MTTKLPLDPLVLPGDLLTAEQISLSGLDFKLQAAIKGVIANLPYVLATGMSTASTAAQNSSAILSAISKLPSNGGKLILPAGVFNIDPFTPDRPVWLEGQGRGATPLNTASASAGKKDFNGTTLISSSNSVSAITDILGASRFSNFRLKSQFDINGKPTSSSGVSGILVGDGTSHGYGGSRNIYDTIVVEGFDIGVNIQNGDEWRMQNCEINGPLSAGIQINNAGYMDNCDSWILNTAFHGPLADYGASPLAAILWRGGGGLYIKGVKTNVATWLWSWPNANFFWQHVIWFQPLVSGSTGIIDISGNSLESTNGSPIFIDLSQVPNGGTYKLSSLMLCDNESMVLPAGIAQGKDIYQVETKINGSATTTFGSIQHSNCKSNYSAIARIENVDNYVARGNRGNSYCATPLYNLQGNGGYTSAADIDSICPSLSSILVEQFGTKRGDGGNTWRYFPPQIIFKSDIANWQQAHIPREFVFRLNQSNVGGISGINAQGWTFTNGSSLVTLTLPSSHSYFNPGTLVYVSGVTYNGAGADTTDYLNNRFHRVKSYSSGACVIDLGFVPGNGTTATGGYVSQADTTLELTNKYGGGGIILDIDINGYFNDLSSSPAVSFDASLRRVLTSRYGAIKCTEVFTAAAFSSGAAYSAAGTNTYRASAQGMNGNAAGLCGHTIFSTAAGSGYGLEVLITGRPLEGVGTNAYAFNAAANSCLLTLANAGKKGTGGCQFCLTPGEDLTIGGVTRRIVKVWDDRNIIVDQPFDAANPLSNATVTAASHDLDSNYKVIVMPWGINATNRVTFNGHVKIKMSGIPRLIATHKVAEV